MKKRKKNKKIKKSNPLLHYLVVILGLLIVLWIDAKWNIKVLNGINSGFYFAIIGLLYFIYGFLVFGYKKINSIETIGVIRFGIFYIVSLFIIVKGFIYPSFSTILDMDKLFKIFYLLTGILFGYYKR
ncbi:MAG: hypothetical protein WAO56_02665 [Miniphocaeibacter sp.]|uniref:hypothetical protein n=1 Tax=Miniphocaeibacter sp. TaxID=3100973 RepID=UPI001790211F|nr:hypothetical protein [Gallicola sp.]